MFGAVQLSGLTATVSACAMAVSASIFVSATAAQTQPLRPGEAFVTRFSGVAKDGGPGPVIDPNGPVGVIIGLAAPQEAPLGQHLVSKPLRAAVRAAQVGQVFGVALDDQSPPNVYLTASAAFGLHRAQGAWMPGMWGQGAGPGAVWRLDAANGYRPALIAEIAPQGRPNSGASLGNIAFDRLNRQFFVSDMESGLIVRMGRDGRQLSAFDHGVEGRRGFFDADSNQRAALAPIPNDPSRTARIETCEGPFDQTLACWNFAPSGRRVWGLGVRRDPMGAGSRLYYAVWSSPAFADASWSAMSEEDKRNAVWSVGLGINGDFEAADVRREFILPDFFTGPADIERAGYSQPVSDIAFSECSARPVMLVAERGGVRNLGLGVENAFATPREARTLRYELDQRGVWRAVGRYDVGSDDRRTAGPPFINANCAGGAAFGPDIRNPLSPAARDEGPDSYVWITGDNLCGPSAPCRFPAAAPQPASSAGDAGFEADTSQVHGLQGNRADLISEVVPLSERPAQTSSPALENAYFIDVDPVLDPRGGLDDAELTRNDATMTGDVAVYQTCLPPPPPRAAAPGVLWVDPIYLVPLPPPGFLIPGHAPDLSHAQWASHGVRTSHFRYGSHNPVYSHQRWRSHQSYWSHGRAQSHAPAWSHNRIGSHNRWVSGGHDERRSHSQYRSHSTTYSHNPRISQGHTNAVSSGHDRRISWHSPNESRGHSTSISQGHDVRRSQGHDPVRSNGPTHNPVISQGALHNTALSSRPLHDQRLSTRPLHSVTMSRSGGHQRAVSSRPTHNPVVSNRPVHAQALSRGVTHNPVVSRGPTHTQQMSRGLRHNPQISRAQAHSPAVSRSGVIRQPDRPRIQQPRIQQPRMQQPPRIQQPRVQQPRMQQPRIQQPRMQQQRIQPPRGVQQRQPQTRGPHSQPLSR